MIVEYSTPSEYSTGKNFNDFSQKTGFFEDGFLVSIFVNFCPNVLKKKSQILEYIPDIEKNFIVVEYSMPSEYSTGKIFFS